MRIDDRQHHLKRRIKYWLPVCAWAGLIFFFSTDHFSSANTAQIFGSLFYWLLQEISTEEIALVHGAVRKLGHWSEYCVLAVLMLRALRNETGKKWELRHAIHTLIFVLLYAIGDEFHQSFVPSRTASFGDVMINALGGVCGISWTYRYGRGIVTPLTSRIKEN